MHPDIIDALRLAMAQHPEFLRRRNYAFGGSPMASGFDPTSYYTPQVSNSMTPFIGQDIPDRPEQVPTTQTGQSYAFAPLYPAAGSGVNIPKPPPPVGHNALMGASGGHQQQNAMVSPNWQLPYDSMRNSQLGGAMATGSGLKTGPAAINNRAAGGPVWDKPRPKSLGKPKPLSSKQKSKAKAAARAAGRPYPNLIDSMRAAKGK